MTFKTFFLCCTLVIVAFVFCVNGGLLGGRQPVSVHDDGVRKAADFAEVEVNKRTNNLYYMITTEIVNAEKQIVKGTKYFLTLEMTSTDCRKNSKFPSDEEIDSCKVSDKEDAHRTEMCYVEVYVNVPQEADEPSLEQFKCEPVKDDQVIKQNKKLKFH